MRPMSLHRTRLVAVSVSATVTAAVVAAAVFVDGSSLAGFSPSRDETPAAADARWQTPDASVLQAAADLLTDAGVTPGETARISVVTNVDGVPQVDVKVVSAASAASFIEDAQDQEDTLAVTVDTKVSVLDETGTAGAADPLRGQQWALGTLDADNAWKYADGTGVRVAVLDTGVDAAHQDLAGQVASGAEFIGGDGTLSTGNGQVDAHGHGSHVAGIIAAARNNGAGIAGLAPKATIVPVRVLNAAGEGWNSDVANGIIWSVNNGANVINMSLGGAYDAATKTAVEYALAAGVPVVAAAGNERLKGNKASYPGAYPGVVAVAATSVNNSSGSFSNTGDYLAVAAPGVNILSTAAGSYTLKSGTSMAAPYVTAVVALMLDRVDLALTPAQVTAALTGTTKDLGGAGFDTEFGYGLVQSVPALCAVATCPDQVAPPVTPPPTKTPTPPVPPVPPTTTDPGTPTTKPVIKREPVALTANTSTRYAWYGQRVKVKGNLTLDASGRPAAAEPVIVSVFEGKRLVSHGTYKTNRSGKVAVQLTIKSTTKVTMRHPRTNKTETAKTTAKFIALPKVDASYTSDGISVRVSPAVGQRVELQRQAGAEWVTVSGGRATGKPVELATSSGTWRVRIGSGKGLASVDTESWRVP